MSPFSIFVVYASLSLAVAACGGANASSSQRGAVDTDALTRCLAQGDGESEVSKCEEQYFGTEWRRSPPPASSLPEGHLDPRLVQASLDAHRPRLRACFRAGVGRDPNLRGEVKLRFVVLETGRVGRVEDAGSKLKDAQVLSCMRGEVAAIRFPRPEGGFVTVVYPMLFSPGDTQR